MPDDRCQWPGCDNDTIWGGEMIDGHWRRFCRDHGMILAQADDPEIMAECIRLALEDMRKGHTNGQRDA